MVDILWPVARRPYAQKIGYFRKSGGKWPFSTPIFTLKNYFLLRKWSKWAENRFGGSLWEYQKMFVRIFDFFDFLSIFGAIVISKNRFFLTLMIIAAKMQHNCVSRKVTTLTWSAYNQETILQKPKDFDHANISYACFCEPIWYSHSEYSRKKTTQTKRLYFFAR